MGHKALTCLLRSLVLRPTAVMAAGLPAPAPLPERPVARLNAFSSLIFITEGVTASGGRKPMPAEPTVGQACPPDGDRPCSWICARHPGSGKAFPAAPRSTTRVCPTPGDKTSECPRAACLSPGQPGPGVGKAGGPPTLGKASSSPGHATSPGPPQPQGPTVQGWATTSILRCLTRGTQRQRHRERRRDMERQDGGKGTGGRGDGRAAFAPAALQCLGALLGV